MRLLLAAALGLALSGAAWAQDGDVTVPLHDLVRDGFDLQFVVKDGPADLQYWVRDRALFRCRVAFITGLESREQTDCLPVVSSKYYLAAVEKADAASKAAAQLRKDRDAAIEIAILGAYRASNCRVDFSDQNKADAFYAHMDDALYQAGAKQGFDLPDRQDTEALDALYKPVFERLNPQIDYDEASQQETFRGLCDGE